MNESSNPAPIAGVDSNDEFNHRFALLKLEVSRDFPQLMPQLEAGRKVILVTDQELASSLHPDILRRVGGMTTLCSLYGAAVVVVNKDKIIHIDGGEGDPRGEAKPQRT